MFKRSRYLQEQIHNNALRWQYKSQTFPHPWNIGPDTDALDFHGEVPRWQRAHDHAIGAAIGPLVVRDAIVRMSFVEWSIHCIHWRFGRNFLVHFVFLRPTSMSSNPALRGSSPSETHLGKVDVVHITLKASLQSSLQKQFKRHITRGCTWACKGSNRNSRPRSTHTMSFRSSRKFRNTCHCKSRLWSA